MAKAISHAARNAAISEFLPRSLVAASVPLAKQSQPLQVAYHAACQALDTEQVCLVTSVAGGKVHYLAGAASDFAAQQAAATILACALPGSAAYRGPAVYLCPISGHNLMACVIASAAGIRCFVGSQADAMRFREVEQQTALPVIVLTSKPDLLAQMPRWRPFQAYEREDNQRLLQQTLRIGIANCILMALIWAGAATYGGYTAGRAPDLSLQVRQLAAMAQDAAGNSNRHPAWQELQNVSSFVLEHQGRVKAFQLAAGKTTWSVELPEFMTGEQIAQALGSAVHTSKEGARIQVTKK